MENMEKKKLKIPENTSDRNDFVRGVGIKEVGIILGALIGCVVLLIIMYSTSGNAMTAFFTAAFILSIVVICVVRDSANETLIDKIKIFIRYLRSQKQYNYKQYDWIEEVCANEDSK